jgi:hypothetical protein
MTPSSALTMMTPFTATPATTTSMAGEATIAWMVETATWTWPSDSQGCLRKPLWQKASVRARVEHAFRVLERQFGYAKVRYRGLAKSTAQLQAGWRIEGCW